MALDFFGHYKSPIINSQSQLERLLPAERKLVGIDNKVIIDVDNNATLMGVRKLEEDHYKLLFPLGRFSDLADLRHELFHIADKSPSPIRIGQYMYWNEPRAIFYSATGLKL